MGDQSWSASIRVARSRDAQAILDLWARAETAPSATDDVGVVRNLIARDSEALLVAEADGTLIATLIAAFDGWRANMYRLAVLPEYRRRGVARALVEDGERRLRLRGARRFSVFVIEEQEGAAAFWQTMGYQHDGHTARFAKTS